jgi:Rps23 Pro-64 3,4-dihydroxylase Tpa1-like proline 4-hydroxylase
MGRGRHVSREVWEQADPVDRYFRFDASPEWTAHDAVPTVGDDCPLSVAQMLEMLRFARAITGEHLEAISLELHSMNEGDFIAPHRDVHLGRRFAGNVYLNDWEGKDGVLRINGLDGQVTDVVPALNRLVFFDVRRHQWHEVTPCRGNDIPRVSASFCFF